MSKILETFAISMLTVLLLAAGFLLGSAYNMSETEQATCLAGWNDSVQCNVALRIDHILN